MVGVCAVDGGPLAMIAGFVACDDWWSVFEAM